MGGMLLLKATPESIDWVRLSHNDDALSKIPQPTVSCTHCQAHHFLARLNIIS